ncbi:hypothetical protein MHTCC0001_36770 [Flavobacteriaceae bacterium MHTCC 0001]
MPGSLCEVDHVHGWALGRTPTDIDQLALTCGWHNRFKHANPDQIQITKGHGGRYLYRLLPPAVARGTRGVGPTGSIGPPDNPALGWAA